MSEGWVGLGCADQAGIRRLEVRSLALEQGWAGQEQATTRDLMIAPAAPALLHRRLVRLQLPLSLV